MSARTAPSQPGLRAGKRLWTRSRWAPRPARSVGAPDPLETQGCKLRRSSLSPARPPAGSQSHEAAQALRDPVPAVAVESGAAVSGPQGPSPLGPQSPGRQHSRISARASARGCSPWLLRPRPPALSAPAPGSARPWARARVWPRAPAPVTAWAHRAVRGVAAAPQRSCPARPAAAG